TIFARRLIRHVTSELTTMKKHLPILIPFAVLLSATAASGQDQFGRLVALNEGQLFVLKANAGLGPAAIYVYDRNGDAWENVQRLRPADGVASGEGFSRSFGVGGGMLLAGSGDPAVAWGARVFVKDGNEWEEVQGLPLIEDFAAAGPDPNATFDLATLRRIMSPPPRSIVLDADVGVAAVIAVGAPGEVGDLRIFERNESGSWVETARQAVPEPGSNDLFGAVMAFKHNWLLVGAPQPGGDGAVYVYYYHGGDDGLESRGTLAADLPEDARFGSAIAFDGTNAYVGAPRAGSGVVVSFVVSAMAEASGEVGRLTPTSADEGALFGQTIVLDRSRSSLWVGAPMQDGGRGAVHGFHVHPPSSDWQAEDFELGGEGYRFGTSIAAAGGTVAVGAPGADGDRGRVAVYSLLEGAILSPSPTWLRHRGDFETVATGSEVECTNGQANGFRCDKVNLAAFLPVEALGGVPGERLSDIWGWTDPETGSEYALVGRTNGVAIVDITRPSTPIYLGVLPANRSGTRDIKVYADHMFVTGGGAGDHGMLVFDLTRLRGVATPPVEFEPDVVYDGISSAHNLVIDTENGFAFTVGNTGGGETCGGGLHMVDIRNPLTPTFAGCYTDTAGLIWQGRTHDAQCVEYRGPDEDYRGRQICLASNETALRIVDVTDKDAPNPISAATYPGIAYVHQGWLTEDQRYFFLDDELDELVGKAATTRTMVWDLADLDDPVMVTEYFGPDPSTDHNLYVKGDRMYQANYQSGLRVIDISDPEHPTEVGFFDTTPYEGNPAGFGSGAWTAFPFFESGIVVVSSINEGLFVLRPVREELVP
ncbi:MAG: choice-of-anchor B family protein, partial [Gemmatimonadales bacterium]